MDDRLVLPHTVHPNAGLVDGIVHAPPLGPAKALYRLGGPLLQGERLLIGLDEMQESDGAIHQGADLVEGLVEHLVDGMGIGKL